MPDCPLCQVPLHTTRHRDGICYRCPECDGFAATLPQVRRVAGDRFASTLTRLINRSGLPDSKACPFCSRTMSVIATDTPQLELDACRSCGVLWFDPGEYPSIPQGGVESIETLQLRAAEALGQHRLKQLRDSQPALELEGGPDDAWKWLPGLLGMPVELDAPGLSRRPWATWILAAVITIASFATFPHLEPIVQEWGLVPAAWWRHGTLTWLTSFFLHAGILHLVGNVYFLLIFGDNVEDLLGRSKWVALVALAAVAGDLAHVLADPRATTPCVGASGGISGLVVFYALAFPRARLGFLFRYFLYLRWLQIPAWAALVLWLLLQTLGATLQLHGEGSVSALAHLGGAGVGLAAWFTHRHHETSTTAA